jgi:hypothetical protein
MHSVTSCLDHYCSTFQLKRNYDEWYLQHKQDLKIDVAGVCAFSNQDSPDSQDTKKASYYKYSMSQDIVSFHYVDIHETKVLYQYLTSCDMDMLTSVEMLLNNWPHTSETIGPYAIKLTSASDAKDLLAFLTSINRRITSCGPP